MKSTTKTCVLFLTALFSLSNFEIKAQENKRVRISTGADLYSSYVWRGTRYGNGPAFQPKIELKSGSFTAGAWGSFDFSNYQETDLYMSLALPAGFSLGVTDYYYPAFDYFDYTDTTGSHAFEVSLGFSAGGFSLSANYILNEAGNAGSSGGDKYFEARYSFDAFNIFIGAGDGWHTVNDADGSDRFAICNIGMGTSKEIRITDNFTIPVTGQLVFNPDLKRMYITAGFSF